MNDHQLPDGLAQFLDSCGMRPPNSSMQAEAEIAGFELGIQCAQRLLRGYDQTAVKPDASKAAVIAKYHGQIDDYIVQYGLDRDEQFRCRVGFSRGLSTQLLKPDARIEIRLVEAPVVV